MDIKEISLFPHNEQGYELLCNALEKYPLAFLEHATGTGKSFILLKYLYTKMLNKRILFISSHDEMFEQLFNEQMSTLGIKRSDFAKFDTLIYPNITKYDMKDIIKNYDCIVFDEAQHTGAPKWSIKVAELKELVLKIPGKQMIGATATRIRYLDDYMDVAEMYFDGQICSTLSISYAILNNLLPAPFYVNTLSACADEINKTIRKFPKLIATPETNALLERTKKLNEKINLDSSVPYILQKYGVKKGEKYIVFCKDIADLKRKKQEATEWFKDIGPIKTYAAHSEQSKEQNISEIKGFSSPKKEISLMFAVDIFNEGFHIDGVDGILMFRKTKSPIIYFQQLGRALSFSARKKQIKIFDFVNNISENDIIYELYKELISEAHRLLPLHPEKQELYEEIINRFQIIDYTSSILDEIRTINKVLDEKYIVRNRLDYAINLLIEYRNFYPHTNFKQELYQGRISHNYINAYNYICQTEDYLTDEQIDLLKTLNIEFTEKINLPKSKRQSLLKGSKTFKELYEKEYDAFCASYYNFISLNHRRPSSEGSTEEQTLYHKYRSYLMSLSKNKLNRFLSKLPAKLTIEETILIGNYPSKEEIESYTTYIKTKLKQNIPLDEIERKLLKKIRYAISLKNIELQQYIDSIDTISSKLAKAIIVIEKYKKENPQDRLENIYNIRNIPEVYQAIKFIHTYAKRITNAEFKRLLALDIKLPTVIDMTLADRLELLDGCDSLYEKEQQNNVSIFDKYLLFIKKHHRRPSNNIPNEQVLVSQYEEDLLKTNTSKVKNICKILSLYHIELTFYEKVIIGEKLPINDIITFINKIEYKLSIDESISPKELKLLRAINNQNYSKDLIDLDSLINMISSMKKNKELITNIENLYATSPNSNLNNSNDLRIIIRTLFHNYKYLTLQDLARLQILNIEIPEELITELNNSKPAISLYDKERRNFIAFYFELLTYFQTLYERPEKNSPLDKKYRHYLAILSPKKLTALLSKIKPFLREFTFEEKVLLNNYRREDSLEYLALINEKTAHQIPLDLLEKRVVNILKKSLKVAQNIKITKDSKKESSSATFENRLVSNIIDSIRLNPQIVLITNPSFNSLSVANQKKVFDFQNLFQARKVFIEIISLLKTSKKPLRLCLSPELNEQYLHSLEIKTTDSYYHELLATIKKLDCDYEYKLRGTDRLQFINDYLSFIESHHGLRPNLDSSSKDESFLAKTYHELNSKMSKKELTKIDIIIKKSTEEDLSVNFFNRFYEFIITNGRFPCGSSNDSNEVQLNNLYQLYGTTLTKEQTQELKKLKKLYARATLQANIGFAKKIKQ